MNDADQKLMVVDADAEAWRDLRWRVDVSIRYHSRRASFFGDLHRTTAFIGVMSGTAIVGSLSDIIPEWVAVAAATFITVMSAIDMVIGYSAMEQKHIELRNAFIRASRRIGADRSMAAYESIRSEMLTAEESEPPTYQALQLAAYNEVVMAQYPREKWADRLQHLHWFKRITGQLLRWDGI